MERALAELRAGRPVLLADDAANGGQALLAAVDAIGPTVFEAIAARESAVALALSEARARAIGLPVEGAVSLAIAGLDRDAILRLAGGADARPPSSWVPAGALELMGIELCKQALLLPAVLIAEDGAS